MKRQIGFYALTAIVIGSQLGSGVFILPAALAEYGPFSLIGCLLSGIGAILLTLVFGNLAMYYPDVGGPHIYIAKVFGFKWGFFATWCYWIVSFVSTTVVVVTGCSYIVPILASCTGQSVGSEVIFGLEVVCILIFMTLNLFGSNVSAKAEMVLSLLKIIPMVVLPIGCFFYFNKSNFNSDVAALHISFHSVLSNATLIAFWGFIGLESGTTPVETVKNPQTISRALVWGTSLVALIYMAIGVAVMGVIPIAALRKMDAPFVAITQIMVGGQWHLAIGAAVFMVCLGTLNAWIFISGQIASSAGKTNMLPVFFAKTNRYSAPQYSIAISSLGIIPFLVLTLNSSLKQQLLDLIDVSVIIFLWLYLLSVCAYGKLLWNNSIKRTFGSCMVALFAGIFSVWMIVSAMSWLHVTVWSIILVSGLPVYAYMKKQKHRI